MKTQIAISLFVSMTLCGNLLVQNTQGGYNVQGNIALQSQQQYAYNNQADISAQIAENAKLQAQILEAEGQILQAQQQVQTLQTQNEELNSQNAALSEQVAALQAEIGDFNAFDFQEEMNYLRGVIDGLKTKIQADQTRVKDLQAANSRQKETIAQLEQTVATLESANASNNMNANNMNANNSFAGLNGQYQIAGGYLNVQGGLQANTQANSQYQIVGNHL